MPICRYFQSNNCRFGNKCNNIHDLSKRDARHTVVFNNKAVKKTRCNFFDHGYCKNGDNCKFLHVGKEVNQNQMPDFADSSVGNADEDEHLDGGWVDWSQVDRDELDARQGHGHDRLQTGASGFDDDSDAGEVPDEVVGQVNDMLDDVDLAHDDDYEPVDDTHDASVSTNHNATPSMSSSNTTKEIQPSGEVPRAVPAKTGKYSEIVRAKMPPAQGGRHSQASSSSHPFPTNSRHFVVNDTGNSHPAGPASHHVSDVGPSRPSHLPDVVPTVKDNLSAGYKFTIPSPTPISPENSPPFPDNIFYSSEDEDDDGGEVLGSGRVYYNRIKSCTSGLFYCWQCQVRN